MKKVALHTLGCKVNTYETAAMQQSLEAQGYDIVPFSDKADIYIVNTCTVTNIADRKSRQMLHKAKKMNKEAVVVAVGCYVQSAREALEADDTVDIIIGNNKKKDLIQILDDYEANHFYKGAVIDINETSEYETLSINSSGEHTRAFIKIQDGCNMFCTYCIIPFARGRVRSRKAEDIIAEITKLVNAGYKEAVLTGIHLSSYGIDFENKEEYNLLSLIEQINEISGLDRIRLGSLEPRIVTEKFVLTLSKMKKFCPHFHLSLQSGCDVTLKRMNRRYDTKEFKEKCELLRKYFDNPAITTDIIAGFPGETEEEFENTYEFLKNIAFAEMHVFKYSKRSGTKAAIMENQISDSIKHVRSEKLIKLGQVMSDKFIKNYEDKILSILVEEETEIENTKYLAGYSKEYIKVLIPANTAIKGEIIDVKFDKKYDNTTILCERITK